MAKGMNDMFKQVQKMQKDMEEMQTRLAEEIEEGQSGGGMVTCKVNGKHRVVELKIDPDCVDPEDLSLLEDLVLAAVNAAIDKIDDKNAKELSKVTGGMSIPGLF